MRPNEVNRSARSDTKRHWTPAWNDCWLCELSCEVRIQRRIQASTSVLAGGESCWVSLGLQNSDPTKSDQRASLSELPDGATAMQKVQLGLEAKLVRQPRVLEKIGGTIQRFWVRDAKLETKTKAGEQSSRKIQRLIKASLLGAERCTFSEGLKGNRQSWLSLLHCIHVCREGHQNTWWRIIRSGLK